mmetsp:Transcript_55073/g.131244  ORF Transcript_55073/g.131244 Transcript_55073/m.131244 type:complete len:91 (-) Transcript_55073:98-370(-)
MKPNGEPLVTGQEVTGFTNSEVEAAGLQQACEQESYLIESRFSAVGGDFRKGTPSSPACCYSKNILTAQNARGAAKLARQTVVALHGNVI